MNGTCDDSRLCHELAGATEGIAFHQTYQGDPPSRIIRQTPHFSLLSDYAPLVEGHLLLLPNWHAISFGQVPGGLWPELKDFVDRTIRVLSDEYGPPLILEHGSSSCLAKSPCISHAHWHFIPVDADLTDTFAADGLGGAPLTDPEDLMLLGSRDESYIFYHNIKQGRMICYTTGLSKRNQYVRMVVGEKLGLPDPQWDYGLHQRVDFLRAAVSKLSAARWG